ncbi:isoaspartyl peptidase/L-asparaginase family protein, partial [Bacteroidota bacterium]
VREEEKVDPVLVIHGGAGTIEREKFSPEMETRYIAKLKDALEEGYFILVHGGTSTDAVIRSIQILEESPLFNAGVGAVFTNEKKIELDASIMEGSNRMAGAVAGVSHIKSPIEAAHAVMTMSPYVLLTGKGAEKFAEQNGLEMVNPDYFYTEKRYQQILKIKESEKVKTDPQGKITSALPNPIGSKFGTVGAVALDNDGNLAAGTSTGGMTNKAFSRVGDSPIIGAGTYADNRTCAVSATGHGEFFIRNVVAYDIAARMKYQNKDLKTAADEVIQELKEIKGFGGVICLDKKGNIAMSFNTTGMYRGYIREKGKAEVALFGIPDNSNFKQKY